MTGGPGATTRGTAADVEDIYPVTPLQAGILYHTLSDPGSGVYVVQYTCEIRGALDPAALRAAWENAARRHPVLRTAFAWEGLDEPLQAVRARVDLSWTEVDWTDLEAGARDERLEAHLRADRARGFALDRAPLMRLLLARIGPDAWRFLWTFHHILADGWSAVTLLGEVFRDAAGSVPDGPEAPRPFRDFVAWLESRDGAASRSFWEHRLEGAGAPTRLSGGTGPHASGSASPAVPPSRHVRRTVGLSADDTRSLEAFARAHRLTLSTLLHGAWSLVLSRYAGSSEVLYGGVVSGRPHSLEGVASMIGLFINTVPIRVRVPDDARVPDWLRSLQNDLVDIGPHEQTSLVQIAGWTGVGAPGAGFESLLVFESAPDVDVSDLGFQIRDVRYLDQSEVPLAVLVFPGDQLSLTALVDTSRFDPDLAERLVLDTRSALLAIERAADATIGTLPPPDDAGRARLLAVGRGPDVDEARDVLARFDARVREQPSAIAVVAGDASWTYAELARRVEATAARLREAGVGAGARVALPLGRSPGAIAAMLATLRIDAAYVPISPEEAVARVRAMVADADITACVTAPEAADTPALEALAGLTRIEIADEDIDAGVDAGRSPAPDDRLAYILYTSGSTGGPKGVAVTRANLAFSTAARYAVYEASPRRFMLLSPLSFDSSVAGIYWTLSTGGALVLPEEGSERDPHALLALARDAGVTHTLLIPGLWELLLDRLEDEPPPALETVIVAGEPCPRSLVLRHHERLTRVALHNEYGPTEATVWATGCRLSGTDDGGPVPIGRPIPGTSVYLLDANGRLVPEGAVGEICVAGPGVALGYLGHAEPERFGPDPFDPARRMYRTGDRARWLPDGGLEFLGRFDDQIKIRGHRIEIGEVESALGRIAGVREAAVVVRGRAGSRRLVAYVVLDLPEGVDGLRPAIGELLPEFLIPDTFVTLDALPRGPRGKVDRDRLPAPAAEPSVIRAPETSTEREMARVWAEILDRSSVSVDDHFFAVGGHSLLAIRLLGRVEDVFGVRLAFAELFATPTVASMAARIDERRDRRLADPAPEDEAPEAGMEEFEI